VILRRSVADRQYLDSPDEGRDLSRPGAVRSSSCMRRRAITWSASTGAGRSRSTSIQTVPGVGGLPRTVPMAFPWPARTMTLTMSDGTKRHVRLVQGAGLAFALVRAPRRPSIDEWNVYDGHGRRLSGGQGAPGGI
jgi:hypothetical protein